MLGIDVDMTNGDSLASYSSILLETLNYKNADNLNFSICDLAKFLTRNTVCVEELAIKVNSLENPSESPTMNYPNNRAASSSE